MKADVAYNMKVLGGQQACWTRRSSIPWSNRKLWRPKGRKRRLSDATENFVRSHSTESLAGVHADINLEVNAYGTNLLSMH